MKGENPSNWAFTFSEIKRLRGKKRKEKNREEKRRKEKQNYIRTKKTLFLEDSTGAQNKSPEFSWRPYNVLHALPLPLAHCCHNDLRPPGDLTANTAETLTSAFTAVGICSSDSVWRSVSSSLCWPGICVLPAVHKKWLTQGQTASLYPDCPSA